MTMVDEHNIPLRVLSLSGGGMRGLYSSTYLNALEKLLAKKLGKAALDIGSSFDLIAGTSTGGILACALAAGVPMSKTSDLYRDHGKNIFPQKMPTNLLSILWQTISRPYFLRKGEEALINALQETFGAKTVGQVFDERNIGLAIPAVEMTRHGSWVFKSAHLSNSNRRDDNYSLADVCLATSAAPLFRSMANIPNPDDASHNRTFVDGGLWANDPILVGLIDALEMAPSNRPIEIYCLGTCKRPEGEILAPEDRHRGFLQWKFGGDAASLAIDAQEFAYYHMARMLSKHVENDVQIIRFPSEPVSGASLQFLGLDGTSDKALTVLSSQAHADANLTLSAIGDPDNEHGQLIANLFEQMEEVS